MKPLVALPFLLLAMCSSAAQNNDPVFSRVAVLTIHVSSTNVHDGVFHLLTDILKLPVDYYPETHGQRRYAAVHAGNMFIEPCGPFPERQYPEKGFAALFFGLNCVSDKPAPAITARLDALGMAYEKAGANLVRIQDRSAAEGIFLSVDTKPHDKSAQEHEAALHAALRTNSVDGLGFEYVKELWLGCTEPATLNAWTNLLGAPATTNEMLCPLGNQQSIRLIPSDTKGLRAIVCKVRSLKRAEQYLRQTGYYGRPADGRIELDRAKTFGLSVYLVGD